MFHIKDISLDFEVLEECFQEVRCVLVLQNLLFVALVWLNVHIELEIHEETTHVVDSELQTLDLGLYAKTEQVLSASVQQISKVRDFLRTACHNLTE